MAFIQTKDLKFTYDDVEDGEAGKVHEVLKGVNLDIQKGEFVALLGHNGSGKSTIAKMFNAMLLPAGGKVYVEGMDTLDESLVYEIRRRVGLVLQNPDNQLVASIVEEDVAFGPENLGIAPEEIRRRVDDALKAVEMYDYRLNAPTSSPAAKSSASPSRGSSRCSRSASCWTSRPQCSTRAAGKRCCGRSTS